MAGKSTPPNPKWQTTGRPMVPVSGVNAGDYRLVRYQTGQMMVEYKGVGRAVPEGLLLAFLRGAFKGSEDEQGKQNQNSVQ